MRVYLVRHGKAKPVEEDSNCSLTDKGHDEVTRVAEFLACQRITVSLIQHSGKARAEETAHIFATHLRAATGPSHTTGLDPEDDPAGTANFLKVYTDDILIVGHLPHLERLTSLLLTGSTDCRPVRFPNGAVVCLEKEDDGTWSLVWAIVPELLQSRVRLAA
jgi:phosphohistidine phosphatase